MTSSSLQFGPEWMRKPAHTKQQQGNSAATQHQNQHQPASNASAPQAKRLPSLGTMSPGGPTPVLTPTTAPSPGTFSFAAAAAGGMDRGASSNSGHSPSHSFSAAVPGGGSAALDRDAALRYARDQSLSLYSSKGSLSPSTDGQPMSADAASPSAVAANGSDTAHGSQSRKKASGERDGLKRLGSTEPLSPTLPSEPRGLNARGTTASSDRERPGLFQRASSGGSLGGTGVQRERFSGIQGGVLSGVAPPEQQRRRKESEGSSRLLKHPSATNTAHGEQQDGEPALWDKRSGGSQLSSGASEAFASAARMGRSKPSLDNMSIPQQDTGSDKAWTGGRRRERGPSENPGTGAADNAAGFAKFAGYDRKRERTGVSNADTWRSGSATRASPPENQAPDDDSHADPSGETVNDHHNAQPTQTLEQNFAGLDMNGSGAPAASPWSADAQQWLYRDPSGQVQGPFPATTMQSWYEQEYFAQDLLIRPQEEADFHPLAVYFAAAGNNPRFFLAPPPSMRRPADEPPLAPSNGPQDSMFNLNGGQMPGADLGWNGKAGAVPGPGWLDNSLGRAGAAPSQAFGSPFGAFGGLPQSPFLSQPGMGTPGAGEHMGLDARLRQQEDYINAMRQREFEHHHQQQQQQQHPQMGPFDGHYAALDGWNRQPQLWQQSQQAVDQVNSSSHQQSSPWSTSAFPTGMVNDNTPTSAPWGEAPDQKQHQQQVYQPEANVGAIGTPVRARSPAPAPAEQQHALDQAAAQYESSDPAAVEDAPVEEVQEVRDAPAQVEEEPSRPATPPPAEDPAPEHEWPQSPSAVEFASEPDFGSTRDAAEAATTASGRVAGDKKGVRGKAAISIPGKPGSVSVPSAAGGNVKVVGADQFRKGTAAESTSVQTPLSSLLGNNSPASSTASKAAPWAQTNNEEGSAATNAAMSLREIQEAEAKQAEAKRAAERSAAQQRRAAARSNSNTDAAPPTTMSWGLASIPSSVNKPAQSNINVSGADGGPASPATAAQLAGGAWTIATPSAGKPGAKKTLMEIQEEERKQALALQRKQAAAASKAFAESLSRQNSSAGASAAPLPAAAPAPGWSVVGAGGKASTPTPTAATAAAKVSPKASSAVPQPAAQPRTASSSGSPWSTAVNGGVKSVASGAAPASSIAARARPAAITTPSAGKVTSLPATTPITPGGGAAVASAPTSTARDPNSPSPEFLKYCKDQLRALTSNVKVDDFIEMLLSFPLDPTPDVVEIIAESIYANSSTLDGRRLANDFVAKRKMDAGVQEGSSRRNRGAAAAATASAPSAIVNGTTVASKPVAAKPAASSGAVVGSAGGGGGGFQQVVKKSAKRRGGGH